MKNRPKIFVTNDDGITAPGIIALINLMKNYGDVYVVAPDKPMSGVGHAISMREAITVKEINDLDVTKAFACSGTPADCVKWGIGNIFNNELPDLLVSGINHGSNASVNLIYSGTVAGAVEGCLYGIPSIAFSSLSHDENADLAACEKVVIDVMKLLQNKKLPRYVLYNVNVPDISLEELKGIRMSRQSLAHWKEEFQEEVQLNGQKGYWLKGNFVCDDQEDETDIWALRNNYASLVPVYLDLTAHSFLKDLKAINSNERI